MTRPMNLRSFASALFAALLLGVLAWAPPAAAAEVGAVYALSNSPAGNAVLAWNRAADGTLAPAGSYPTGGLGSGGAGGSELRLRGDVLGFAAGGFEENDDLLFGAFAEEERVRWDERELLRLSGGEEGEEEDESGRA